MVSYAQRCPFRAGCERARRIPAAILQQLVSYPLEIHGWETLAAYEQGQRCGDTRARRSRPIRGWYGSPVGVQRSGAEREHRAESTSAPQLWLNQLPFSATRAIPPFGVSQFSEKWMSSTISKSSHVLLVGAIGTRERSRPQKRSSQTLILSSRTARPSHLSTDAHAEEAYSAFRSDLAAPKRVSCHPPCRQASLPRRSARRGKQ